MTQAKDDVFVSTHDLLDEIVRISFLTPGEFGNIWGIPVLLIGPPGCAKSVRIYKQAKRYRLPCSTTILSQQAPEDIGGYPVPSADGKKVQKLPVGVFADLVAADQGVLFVDELTNTPRSLQGPALRLILERVVGEHKFGPGVRVISAANPVEMAADGWELSQPMANRLTICHIMPNHDEFRDYMMGLSDDDSPIEYDEVAIKAQFDVLYPTARIKVVSFLGHRPELLYKPLEQDQAGQSFPTPRSWDRVARLIASCDIHYPLVKGDKKRGKYMDLRRTLVNGTVGQGAATEFLAYLEHIEQLPDPETVLKDPKKAPVFKARPDLQIALVDSVTGAAIRKHEDEKERMARMCSAMLYLERVLDADMSEHAVPGVRTMLKAKPGIHHEKAVHSSFAKFLPHLTDLDGNWK